MTQVCQLCGGSSGAMTHHPEGTRHTQPIESCIRELARRCRILDETTTRWKVVEAPVADLPNGPKQRMCEKCGEPLVGASAILEAKTCIASNACLARQLSAAVARAEKAENSAAILNGELVRVKTAQHGAAHALDNLGIDLGCGHSAQTQAIFDAVETLKKERDKAKAEIEKIVDAGREWWDIRRGHLLRDDIRRLYEALRHHMHPQEADHDRK